MLDMLLVHQ